jgi:hypothetical protein
LPERNAMVSTVFFEVRETVHILHVYETAYAVAYLSCCIGFEL